MAQSESRLQRDYALIHKGKWLLFPRQQDLEIFFHRLNDTVDQTKTTVALRRLVARTDRTDVDRILASVPKSAPKIAVCYDWQLLDGPLPQEPHDVAMDWIVTDKRIVDCAANRRAAG